MQLRSIKKKPMQKNTETPKEKERGKNNSGAPGKDGEKKNNNKKKETDEEASDGSANAFERTEDPTRESTAEDQEPAY
jgi:hypothetical protein